MSSSFLKASSPYSSSYGIYGAGTINPYASYFGPQQPHQQPPTGQTQTSSPSFPPLQGNPFGGAAQPATFNTNQPYVPISSPFSYSAFTSPGGNPSSSSAARLGGSPSYFSPQPTQTKIIGGMNTSGIVGGGGGVNSPVGRAPATSCATNMFGFGSPVANQTNPSGHDPLQHHEPMHYSPIAGTNPTYGHAQSPVYLPCYFLGLDQQHHFYQGGSPPSPGIGGSVGSPGSRVVGPASFMSPPANFRRTVLFEPKSFPENEMQEIRQPVKKAKGPPIHGFESSEGTTTQDFLDAIIQSDAPKNDQNTPISPVMFRNMQNSPVSSTSPTTSSAKCWVTVFGFPGGASSFIVTNFSTLGKIMEIKCTPGSNWLHIRFSSPIEARRALARNGKVLGQSIMVGVIPSDAKVIEEAEKANVSGAEIDATNTAYKSPSSANVDVNVGSSIASGNNLKSRIRPLATGFIPHPTTTTVASPPKSVPIYPGVAREAFVLHRNSDGLPVPTTSTGILTKAMEYMFGW